MAYEAMFATQLLRNDDGLPLEEKQGSYDFALWLEGEAGG
jgi:hypothetical protein